MGRKGIKINCFHEPLMDMNKAVSHMIYVVLTSDVFYESLAYATFLACSGVSVYSRCWATISTKGSDATFVACR